QPGEQEVTFRAATGKVQAKPKNIVIDYQPELPEFKLIFPRSLELGADERLGIKCLEGRLSVLDDPYDYKLVMRVNDKAVKHESDPSKGIVKAPVMLLPGSNRLEVDLSNDRWQKPTQRILLYSRQPPTLDDVTTSKVGDQPFVDVTARVRTPITLPLIGVRL